MDAETRTIQVSADEATRIQADVSLNAGSVQVSSGSEHALDGEFTCTYAEWQPDVNYRVADGVGRLSIVQPRQIRFDRWPGKTRNDWSLRFNKALPLELGLEVNAGKANLELSELAMHGLDIELNAGSVELDLTGDHPHLTRADLELSAARINARINGSFPELRFFDLEMNATRAALDLSGDWQRSQDIVIEANAGWLSIRVPRRAGIQVALDRSLARLNHNGLVRRNGVYVNEAFGKTDVTLRFDVSASVGKIDIEMIDRVPVG